MPDEPGMEEPPVCMVVTMPCALAQRIWSAGGLIDPAMPISVAKLAWLEDLLVRTGNLGKPFDVAAMVDDSARTEALARLRAH